MEPVRTTLGSAIRSRVAGPRAKNVVRDIVGAEGERWFSRDRPIWTVHTDAAMFVGGLRALLLQSLHPLAMAGVADHSDFRADPWGRLQRTADFLTWTTFGTAEQAERACRRVRAVHSTVRGTAPDGRPYDATDPHLLRWVHLAEIDSFLAAHQRYGTPHLDAARARRLRGRHGARRRGPRRDRSAPHRSGDARRPRRLPPRAARHARGARRRPLPPARRPCRSPRTGPMPSWRRPPSRRCRGGPACRCACPCCR